MSASGNYVPDQTFYNYAAPSTGIVAGRSKKYDTCISLFSEFFWRMLPLRRDIFRSAYMRIYVILL